MKITEAEKQKFEHTLRVCWHKMDGKAWQPARLKGNPFFDWAIEEGFLRVVDGLCVFEKIKDAMVNWTEAGKMAMSNHQSDGAHAAMLLIQQELDGVEWNANTLDTIAGILIKTGYRVRDLNDVDISLSLTTA